MQAVIAPQYGGPEVLTLAEVPLPTPRAGEVLVRVRAAAFNTADRHYLSGSLRWFGYGLTRPRYRIPGSDLAGVIEAVGPGVTELRPGDAVYADLSGVGYGALAEYVCAPAGLVAHKPTTLSFEQAAAVPMAAVTALQGLRDLGRLRPGQRIAVQGASGGVGTFAVQLAKALGAHVTAVCGPRHIDLAASLGADVVCDYARADFTRSGQVFDLILGVNGARRLADYRRALTATGTFVAVGGAGSQLAETLLLGPLLSVAGRQRFVTLVSRPNRADLNTLSAMIDAGQVAPVMAEILPLDRMVDAYRSLLAGHVRGKIVLTMP